MKILVIQNKMGIGDMIIYLPFIKAISKKFNTTVSILVKESSKAEQFLKNSNFIDKIIILERNNKLKSDRHEGLIGFYNLIRDLRQYSFDKVFIFNSSFRFNLIAKIAGIKSVHQYQLFKKKNQHIITTANNFLKKEIDLDVKSDPQILIDKKLMNETKLRYEIKDNQLNILLGIGGSGTTKRIPSKIFIKFMDLVSKNYDCKFFLATGKNEEEQIILNEILNSDFKEKCLPLDNLELKEIMPIIKNCKISICNDSSFSHLSAALGIQTIVLMSDTPLLYGSYSPRMHPIIPDGESSVTHDTKGKEKINPKKILEKLNNILN